jgi:hypothetical protein
VIIIDDAGYSGQEMDCLDTAGSYTYELEAYSATNEVVIEELLVEVVE